MTQPGSGPVGVSSTIENPATKSDPGVLPQLTDDDLRAAFSGPAFYANKMYATVLAEGATRIAFMEQVGQQVPPQFRSAVMLSLSDAINLRNLLTRLLRNFEPRIKNVASGVAAEAPKDGD